MNPLQLALQVARSAGEYQRQYCGTITAFDLKGEANPVTAVDKHCEQLIVDGIMQHFPDHSILGEESGAHDRASEWQWIIDPLDGTVNFLHGYPVFCVCIALRRANSIELGVIYDPMRDEMFVAQRGQGATCNDRRLRVSPQRTLQDSLVVTGFAYARERGEMAVNIGPFNAMLSRTRAVRRDGSAGIDLAYVAAGRFDGFWEFYLSPWDVAAGACLVTEAGGSVTLLDGSPFDPFNNTIVASNGVVHQELRTVIQGALPSS